MRLFALELREIDAIEISSKIQMKLEQRGDARLTRHQSGAEMCST